MPWYQFKQSLCLGVKKYVKEEKDKDGKVVVKGVEAAKGKDYLKGVREVPVELESDPQFLKYVKLGLIVEAEPVVVPEAQDPAAKSKALLGKLEAKRASEIKKSEEAPKEEPETHKKKSKKG